MLPPPEKGQEKGQELVEWEGELSSSGECQLIRTAEMTELANRFATISITVYSMDHQCIIKTTRKKIAGEKAIHIILLHRLTY